MYLCCDPCGVCCYFAGPAAASLAQDPALCIGCGRPLTVDDRDHPPVRRAG